MISCHPVLADNSRRAIHVKALFLLVSAIGACTSNNAGMQPYKTPWKLTGKETVAVSAVDDKSDLNFLKPMSGRGGGALAGAGSGIVGALDMGTGCDGIGCALVVPIAVGAGVVGGLVGAANSRSEKEVKEATAALIDALKDAEPSRQVEAFLLSENPVQPNGPRLTKGTSSATTLKLTVRMNFLFTGNRFNPDVVVFLQAVGTLKPSRSGKPSTVTWQHRSKPQSYFALARNDAKLMSDVLRASSAELAKLIRNELSLSTGAKALPPEVTTRDRAECRYEKVFNAVRGLYEEKKVCRPDAKAPPPESTTLGRAKCRYEKVFNAVRGLYEEKKVCE